MKIPSILFIACLLNLRSNCQKVEYIARYFTQYDTAKQKTCFKIGSNTVNFDNKSVCINNKVVIEKDTSSFFFLEVYSKKVLVVSYYPISQSYVSTGPGFRPIHKVEFISLNDPSRRWLFDLRGVFNSECIMSFNELSGELKLNRKMKGIKI